MSAASDRTTVLADAQPLIAERIRTLVELETPTGDRAALRRALDVVHAWGVVALGRSGCVIAVDEVDHLLFAAPARPTVMVLGHVDTVFPAGTLAQWPCTIEGDVARGPGVFDMKSGLVAAIGALERVARPEQVSMLVTTDEEVGSGTSRELIERTAQDAAAVLVAEPSLDGALKTARAGVGLYRLVFEGADAHAGIEPHRGINALVELAHQVLSLATVGDSAAGTSVTPTVASAGTTSNIVPGRAELAVDVRAQSAVELRRVDKYFAALKSIDPRVAVSVEGGVNRPPLEEHLSRSLFELACAVANDRALVRPTAAPATGGASDGNFTAAVGVPTLDGLGPLGGGAHTRAEWASVSSVSERSLLIAGIIDRVTAGEL